MKKAFSLLKHALLGALKKEVKYDQIYCNNILPVLTKSSLFEILKNELITKKITLLRIKKVFSQLYEMHCFEIFISVNKDQHFLNIL